MGILKTTLILIHVIPLFVGVALLVSLESGWLEKQLLPPRPAIVGKNWGAKGEQEDDSSVRKFEVKVPDAVLEDLRRRLQTPRLTPALEDVNFNFGSPSTFMEKVRHHWLHKYNWRSWEKQLNAFPQFKTRIEGLDIHFLHVKPKASKDHKVVPLMLIHGWPGSVLEFYKTIPILTNPSPHSQYVFELIIPSLPGYGWSEASKRQGLGIAEIASIFFKLMMRLKLTEGGFYVQGGDWGSGIAQTMSRMHPEMIRGLHINMLVPPMSSLRYQARLILGMLFPSLVLNANETWKVYPYFAKLGQTLRETGYFHLQATRPDTVGTALNDSPMGLAAYILEKFAAWTEPDFLSKPDGGVTKYFSLDEILTNVMIYWTTGSITTSARLYKESFMGSDWMKLPSTVPTGAAAFPNDLVVCPERWLRFNHQNLIHYSDMPRGGHFAALEEPQLFAEDVIKFVNKVEAWKKRKAAPEVKTDL